jgi:hypothetical protein
MWSPFFFMLRLKVTIFQLTDKLEPDDYHSQSQKYSGAHKKLCHELFRLSKLAKANPTDKMTQSW